MKLGLKGDDVELLHMQPPLSTLVSNFLPFTPQMQATAMKLGVERDDIEQLVAASRERMEQGLAPTDDAEREWWVASCCLYILCVRPVFLQDAHNKHKARSQNSGVGWVWELAFTRSEGERAARATLVTKLFILLTQYNHNHIHLSQQSSGWASHPFP